MCKKKVNMYCTLKHGGFLTSIEYSIFFTSFIIINQALVGILLIEKVNQYHFER